LSEAPQSGVGIAFLRLLKAKYPNIHITGTSRSEQKVERLIKERFDEIVIDRDNQLQTAQKV
jgi:NADPH:quinone reductase-like Zn-dependent oxidoreductase